jgi:xanthine dehydrogenase accessory factor
MRDILSDIERWRAEGRHVAVATVVQTWGSAPRQPGAKMALTAEGGITGSVSGGCVENAVFDAGKEILKTGKPRLLHFGVSDDTAWSVGLACGGTIDVFVEPLAAEFYEPVRDALRAGKALAIATVVGGTDNRLGRKLVLLEKDQVIGGPDPALASAARDALAARESRRVRTGEEDVFADVELPPPSLVVVGGVHIAIALVSLAKALGFRTVIVDPREAFGSADRFPHADEIVREWPDRAIGKIAVNSSTAVAVLTHDPKLDDPAITAALASPAFYVGALGSSRTQEKRRKRLLGAGVSEAALSRLYAPIGIDLGGRAPEEIALAIMAQVVAARHKPR